MFSMIPRIFWIGFFFLLGIFFFSNFSFLSNSTTLGLDFPSDPGSLLDSHCTGFDIPVVVIARNNPTLLRLLIQQLLECFDARVIILDDASDFPPMNKYLQSLQYENRITVFRSSTPGGPHSWFSDPTHPALLGLPRFFAYTDSDLRLNSDLPRNFLCVLAHLTQRLEVPKAGLALDLSDKDRMWPFTDFYGPHSIWSWEDNFWSTSVRVPAWRGFNVNRVFSASVDTTFAVYDKGLLNCSDRSEYPSNLCFTARHSVRVSGLFTAKHRPWYPEVIMQLPDDEVSAMFFNNAGSVSNLMHRKGFFGNASEKSEANNFVAKWVASRLKFEKTDDIMTYKCSLEGYDLNVPGVTFLLKPLPSSMTFPTVWR